MDPPPLTAERALGRPENHRLTGKRILGAPPRGSPARAGWIRRETTPAGKVRRQGTSEILAFV